MRKKLSHFGRQYAISTWVIILFVAVILPINLFLIFVTSQYMRSLEELAVNTGNGIMAIYAENLDNEMNTLENYLFYLEERETDFTTASVTDTPGLGRLAYYNVFSRMQENLTINGAKGLYFIARSGERMLASGISTTELAEYRKDAADFAEEGVKKANTGQWNIQSVNGQKFLTLEKTEGILYYGAMIPIEPFIEQIAENLDMGQERLDITVEPQKAGEKEMVISVKLTHVSLYLEMLIERKVISGNLPLLLKFEYAIAFLCLLVIPLLYWLFHKTLIRPMEELEHSLFHMEEFGDFTDYRISTVFYTKELSHVKTAVNGFVDQIQSLRIASYERELEKQRIQMENIMLQVRPHFILNLFHLIYSMAEIRNFEGIQKASMYLSKYFRELLGGMELHTLSAELEVVKGYEGILQMQYPNCFTVGYDIDENALLIEIPVLMIHGFLENVAKYAIRIGNHTEVKVMARMDGRCLEITVVDNGCGIPKKILEEIEVGQAVEKRDGRHIGLSNLKERLRMLYGEKAYMKVTSEENQGTMVRVVLPEKRREDEECHEIVTGG